MSQKQPISEILRFVAKVSNEIFDCGLSSEFLRQGSANIPDSVILIILYLEKYS